MKRQPTEWDNVFSDISDIVLNSKTYKGFIKVNYKKPNNAIKKWAKDLNR